MKQKPDSALYCKVCLLPHDEEIHQATLAVRAWHRRQVIKGFEELEEVLYGEVVAVEEIAETQVA